MGKGKTPEPPTSPSLGEDEDRRMFERELVGVRRLRPGPARVMATPHPAADVRGPSPVRAAAPDLPTAMVVERDGNRITGAGFGVSRATLRDLAHGTLPIEATCDLHGLRAEAARLRLGAFVAESRARGRRVVRVICGRGRHSGPAGPVLMEVACEVFTQSPTRAHVRAFASAAAQQGGEGALMVLLSHPRR